jgi:hypothetical protein
MSDVAGYPPYHQEPTLTETGHTNQPGLPVSFFLSAGQYNHNDYGFKLDIVDWVRIRHIADPSDAAVLVKTLLITCLRLIE